MPIPAPLRILLLDDNPLDRALIQRGLRKDFPEIGVEEAIDGPGFAQALAAGRFDLVITDFHLCWTDGLKNLRAVKTKYPDCPVIMVTGTGTEELAVEAMKAGLDDYVLKTSRHFARLPASVRLVLEKAEKAKEARQAEDRYRALYNRIPIGLFISAPSGQILDVNPAMVEMLGYPSKEALLAADAREQYADPAIRERWRTLLEERGTVLNFELPMRRKDGKIIWVKNNSRAIRDGTGRIVRYEGSMEDVTAAKSLQEQLLQSQKMEALGSMAGGIVHDFNNLLTAISGFADLAAYRLPGGELNEDLAGIRKSTERAHALTRQLLAFSRKQELRPQEMSLNSLIENLRPILARLLGLNVRLVLDLAPEAGSIRADPGQMEQAAINLVVNARDAMPEGGTLTIATAAIDLPQEGSLTPAALPSGRYVSLVCSDTGKGMNAETKSHVFEPFFSTKDREKNTGLGLATVYAVVTGGGGWIGVESEPGKGATFRIYLPRVGEQRAE